uniref:transcriptional adapter 2-beta isoform X1 n=1 Tax=Panthera onca TaxID=9690 RepID=UPI002955C6F8|nr:transcriptional adapter 2-beta isoform X1 [Panthera onca]
MAELGKKYCVYCLAEVSPLRFRCTECQDIELCPECFSAGAEIGHHRRYHGYQLVDGGRFTLWGPEAEGGWTSREEQLLLDAIEQFGFGNWGALPPDHGSSLAFLLPHQSLAEASLSVLTALLSAVVAKNSSGGPSALLSARQCAEQFVSREIFPAALGSAF